MSSVRRNLPARRPDLIVRPLGDDGHHVVKDPVGGGYFKLPPHESFLFGLLDGVHTSADARSKFERRFGESLDDTDLDQFVSLAREFGFLSEPVRVESGDRADDGAVHGPSGYFPAAICRFTEAGRDASPAWVNIPMQALQAPGPAAPPPAARKSAAPALPVAGDATPRADRGEHAAGKHDGGQSLLSFRKSVFDPDRLFGRVEPWLRFVWTRGFVVTSAAVVVAAALVSWSNRREIVTDFSSALVMRWETVLLAWLILVLATTLHEFAHGLTCKHFGGEVHEVGFLLLFFIPCFYCNVSDAWLMREKSRRLWVTLAGAWCDLCVWASAVFVWRATPPETVPHYLAWVVMGVCGVRVFFNFNPLLKLDGYYLLSDAIDLPNLRGRAWGRLAAHVRWLLWGAPRPAGEPRGRFLLAFGAASWAYSALFLCLMLAGFFTWWGQRWGVAGAAAVLALGAVTSRGMLGGFAGGEVSAMFRRRRVRAAGWGMAAVALVSAACVVPVPDRAAGPFKLRALRRAELRAPVAGFLREARFGEGQRVSAGALVVRVEVPDLDSRIAQKGAELAEAAAKASVLRATPGDAGEARGDDDGRAHAFQIAAAEAQVQRLREELKYLGDLHRRQRVESPVEGVLITPHLAEKIGQYFREGELICEVEDVSVLEAEVAVGEQDMARVKPGLTVELKARVAPFDTLRAEVTRVATGVRPAAAPAGVGAGAAPALAGAETGELPGRVVVYCTLSDTAAAAGARPGMTGHARIDCGSDPAGRVYARRLLRYVRTEFWW